MLVKNACPFPRLPQLVKSTIQVSEFDCPTDIITHCPSIETAFPFHLAAFLYERPPNPDAAMECHKKFREIMSRVSGAKVWSVREVLALKSSEDLRKFLIDFCDIKFCVSAGVDPTGEKLKKRFIDNSLSKLSKDNLIDLILLRPFVEIGIQGGEESGYKYGKIPLRPLANLTFTRDQQIVTAKGVVMARFGTVQRRSETTLMEQVWRQLGVEPIGSIDFPGKLEGGDFLPISEELALLGVGVRTNPNAARQLMAKDLLGVDRFVVVEDFIDRDNQRMHFHTVFNAIDRKSKLFLCLDRIARDDERFMRMAHEYRREGGQYRRVKQMPFGKWMKEEGWNVIEATMEQQKKYFLNSLHMGEDPLTGKARLVTINEDVEKVLRNHGFDGQVTYFDFSAITAMYGGVHCSAELLRKH